ncbi:hypothetical protein [Microtetraspora malaysiensis]|uniref:hypothetical protein n=1 Tax=Microtetraspora malaysiensis TaxID=161358 RepID=UPI00082BB924|nr:hypothetical protein [Microtetraspora malaysiensis]
MGLAISVGIIAGLVGLDDEGVVNFQSRLGGLSAALAGEGIVWREPDGPPGVEMRPHIGGFPYSCLHYLRRVFALVDNDQPVTPARGADDIDRDQRWVESSSVLFDSHLLCHSDCAGYYVPVDFEDVVFLPESSGVDGGGMVGSSVRLLRELCRCVPALGIRLDPSASAAGADTGGVLPDAEAARVFALPPEDFATETMVWLTLFEACRVSVLSGHAVVFH